VSDVKIINEIKEKLLGLKNKLKNNLIKKEISKHLENESKYKEFENTIELYIDNIDSLDNFDDNILRGIDARLLRLLERTENIKLVQINIVGIIDNINFLIDNQPKIQDARTQKISREEFYKRYDYLISQLNTFEQDCNLVLQTKAEKVDFKVYKNSNNTISVISGEEKTKLSFTKDKLASIVYDNKEIDYHKSYADVLIEKLLDNSIFDEIDTSKTAVPLSENTKIEELENDNLKLLGQLQKLTERFKQRENDFESVSSILEKSSALESDYINAKEAVLKDLELQVSYNYWEKQVISYTKKYWGYFIGSTFTAIILLFFVFIFLQNNPLIINSANTELTVVKIHSDVNSTKNNMDNKNTFQLWEYGFLILVTTMGVWLIRILIKITLSNYHLSVDANERVIMIKTYLSLLKEGSGFEANDKKVMLDNIFRPTNFGIIKDETSVTIADILSSLKK
jgi:hypothetical protein